ncbi:MAG: hypothetical protein KKA05_02635, partial [Alphaproteobacteria bacterium]|nr:hypothetical protein [Alphaproteobacteria bacterium]
MTAFSHQTPNKFPLILGGILVFALLIAVPAFADDDRMPGRMDRFDGRQTEEPAQKKPAKPKKIAPKPAAKKPA